MPFSGIQVPGQAIVPPPMLTTTWVGCVMVTVAVAMDASLLSVTVTVYVPALLTLIEDVVAPPGLQTTVDPAEAFE